jgi:hypothetical protein
MLLIVIGIWIVVVISIDVRRRPILSAGPAGLIALRHRGSSWIDRLAAYSF